MGELIKDLSGRTIAEEQELKIIYDGPSFNGQMEISDLTNQLKSTESIIKEIIGEIYKQKKFKEKVDVKIYLKLKRGSFKEIISVVLNNPITTQVISGCLIALFINYLNKKNKKKAELPKCEINIENLVNNYNIAKDLKYISDPLMKKEDSIRIESPGRQTKSITIEFKDKHLFKKKLNELRDRIELKVSIEEFFGNLLDISLSKHKYGFLLEESSRVIPVNFDKDPSINELRKIFTERLKIKAKATRKDGRIESLGIINYEIKKSKTLTDFIEVKDGKPKNKTTK